MPWEDSVKTTFKPGDLLLFNSGDYDDRNVDMLACVAVAFDIRDHIPADTDPQLVGALLQGKGLVTELEYCDVFTGSYGTIAKRLLCHHKMPRKEVDMGTRGIWIVCPDCDTRMP